MCTCNVHTLHQSTVSVMEHHFVVLFIWRFVLTTLCLWAQVKGVMKQNIEKVMQREEKLEDLGERAGERARRDNCWHRGMYCVLACTV